MSNIFETEVVSGSKKLIAHLESESPGFNFKNARVEFEGLDLDNRVRLSYECTQDSKIPVVIGEDDGFIIVRGNYKVFYTLKNVPLIAPVQLVNPRIDYVSYGLVMDSFDNNFELSDYVTGAEDVLHEDMLQTTFHTYPITLELNPQ